MGRRLAGMTSNTTRQDFDFTQILMQKQDALLLDRRNHIHPDHGAPNRASLSAFHTLLSS